MNHAERAAKDSQDTTQSSILPILKDPASLISLASASSSALTSGYVESLLVLHLETFSISVSSISFCFLAMALSYTSVTIFVGYIADKTVDNEDIAKMSTKSRLFEIMLTQC